MKTKEEYENVASEMSHDWLFQKRYHEKSWEKQANTTIHSEISRPEKKKKKKKSFGPVILQNTKESLQITLGLERSGGEARRSSNKLGGLGSKTLWLFFAYASLPGCSCSPLRSFLLGDCWLCEWALRLVADGPDSIRMKGDDQYRSIR